MITLYFDCFFGVSGEKILGALIDCVGSFDLEDALESVSKGCAEICCNKTISGGIPGVRAEIVCNDNDMVFDDEETDCRYKKIYDLSKDILFMTEGFQKKEFYTLFSVLYILSKTEYDSVLTSSVYDGIGDGTEGNIPDKEIISYMQRCAIDMILTDTPLFVSTKSGAVIISAITEGCTSIPDGDIIKIGYGLGCDKDDISDALRLVILSQRERDAMDLFEASLDFGSECSVSGAYSNKGKID